MLYRLKLISTFEFGLVRIYYGCMIRGKILNLTKSCQGCTNTISFDECNTKSYEPIRIAMNDEQC